MIPEPVIDPRRLDLQRFLADAREGLLGAQAIRDESTLWLKLTARGWPPDAAERAALVAVLEALTDLPVTDAPDELPSSEPINDLERALAAAIDDPWRRPQLWQALHAGEVVLPVVAYDVRPSEELSLNFLTIPLDGEPLVVGFTAEERFTALLSGDADFPWVLAPGPDLPQIWPAGHGLQLNPGHHLGVVLTAEEILHLPHGPAHLRI